jgi:peptidase E
MKLFLASSLADSIGELIPRCAKPFKDIRVLFIGNAADPYPDPWWNKNDRDALSSHGAVVTDIDLRNVPSTELEQRLHNTDIVHVGGGSIFYLLHLLKNRGFDQTLRDAVLKENFLYSGSSAGSIIAAHDVSIYRADSEEKMYSEKLTDYAGLALVSVVVIPHCNNVEFIENNKTMIELLPSHPVACMLLHDHQALWVENQSMQLLSAHQ